MISIEVVPVMWVFWVWLALSVAYFAYAGERSRVETAPSTSPYISERSTHARRAELWRQHFGARGWAHMLFGNGFAGLLLYLTTVGYLWAAVFCAIACLWLIYDHFATPRVLQDIAAAPLGALDRAYYAAGIAVWVYALACVVLPAAQLISRL